MTDYAGMTQLNAVPPALQGMNERILYLARENRSQQLVALQLHPGTSPSTMWLEVLRRLDATLPGVDERCGACQRPVTPGAKFCPKCGADLSTAPQASADQVLEAVKQATASQYEYLGQMEYGTSGAGVFIVREHAGGRLTALRLHKRSDAPGGNQVFDLAGTSVLGRFAEDLGAGRAAPPPDPKLLQAVQRAVGGEYQVLGELGRIAAPAPPVPADPQPEVAPPKPAPVGPDPKGRSSLMLGLVAAGVILILALGVTWWRSQETGAAVAAVEPPPAPEPDSATVQLGGDLPPNAEITVDGEPLALGIHRLAAGPRVIRATAPGFQTVEDTISIAGGEVTVWGPALPRVGKPAPAPAPPPAAPKPKPKPAPPPPPVVVKTPDPKPAPGPVPPPAPASGGCVALFNASQDWNRAFKQCEEEGNGGGVVAQQLVGLMFEKGLGTPVNRPMAAEWFRRAAEAGNAKAQYYYGRVLNDGGGGVKRDREAAVGWFTKAAGAGEPEAMAALGRALMRGEGTSKNKSEGLRWYEQAAAQGVAEAQYQLALLYKNGDTVAKSDSLAVEWMEKAASRGHPKARSEVGKLREEWMKRRGS
jgi:hypothetical protein